MPLPMLSKLLLGFLFATLLLSFSHESPGQAVNETLLGTVTDATGASVANARVIAAEASTVAKHEFVTNESGNYAFPDVTPGSYSATFEARGFKTSATCAL